MGSRDALDGDHIGGPRAVHAHGSSGHVAPGGSGDLGPRPHPENGADGEVGVNNGGAVEGVEHNAEATCSRGWQTAEFGAFSLFSGFPDFFQNSNTLYEEETDTLVINEPRGALRCRARGLSIPKKNQGKVQAASFVLGRAHRSCVSTNQI